MSHVFQVFGLCLNWNVGTLVSLREAVEQLHVCLRRFFPVESIYFTWMTLAVALVTESEQYKLKFQFQRNMDIFNCLFLVLVVWELNVIQRLQIPFQKENKYCIQILSWQWVGEESEEARCGVLWRAEWIRGAGLVEKLGGGRGISQWKEGVCQFWIFCYNDVLKSSCQLPRGRVRVILASVSTLCHISFGDRSAARDSRVVHNFCVTDAFCWRLLVLFC